MIEIEADVGEWLERSGWPTYDSDVDQAIYIYHEWLMTSPRTGINGYLDAKILLEKIITRMRHIHPHPRDSAVISALLILQLARVAQFEGVICPELTRLIH